MYFSHPTAVIDDGARIGANSKIWHFCHVCSGASVGENVSLGQNVFISAGAVVGSGCKIQNNVSIYDGVVLGDDVFCGPSVVFTNVDKPRAFVSRKAEYMPTLVDSGVTLGANATIVCGVTIGEYAFIAAGAVVTKDVLPFALMLGTPARQVGWMSRAGERLLFKLGEDGIERSECPRTGERYSIVSGALTYDN